MTLLRSGSATDVGRVRGSNQDLSLEVPNLFAVADGMGGHAGGEVAARVAVDTLRSAFSRQASVDGLRQSVTEANSAVWRRSQIQSDLRGMGTTLTAVALVAGGDGRDVIALANVGDSRAYVYSGGRITQVTADHSLAEEKVRQGEMTEAEAAVHPHRHILTRALGVAPDVEVDLWELHLQAGDRILLCSDGLTNEVGANQIAEVLGRVPDPTEAADLLVEAANEHGGNDNITVVVIDVVVGEEGASGVQGLGAAAGLAAGTALDGAQSAPAGAAAPDSAPPAPPGPAPAAAPAAGPPAADSGAMPPGTQVGFGAGAAASSLTGSVAAQPSGDLFISAGVPARAPSAVLPGTAPDVRSGPGSDDEEGDRPSRRERRRQRRLAGIPRRVTFRVVLFAVLLIVVIAAAYGFVRWYATDNWYVTLDGSHLAIYQGRPGGLLGFEPKLVDRTSVTTADILPFRIPALQADQQEASLGAARRYVGNLHQEFEDQHRIANGQSPTGATTTTTTTTTAPSATSVPSTTTTTGPVATGTT